jgi:hypothetical protein
MNLRFTSLGWLLLGLLGGSAPVQGADGAAFDLQARKQAQAWIWESPRAGTVPPVRQIDWSRSPVDHFILARLEAQGLQPAPPVDDRTWLRRVHFGITGLPPTRDEQRQFLEDTQPGARERVVERLLASPHFGERWARHWMDLVRYAESRGHEGDYHIANAWQYRDYLIRAFNAGVPYDQFLLEHLAGDLLPQPRLQPGTERNESVLGTGWAFLGEENHSPVDIRQDECDRLDNKLDVFTKTFLGLTVSCARCHDHKFDAISTRDYYGLTGFLLSSSYRQVRFEAMENNRRMAGELAGLRARALPRMAAELGAQRRASLGELPAYLVAAASLPGDGPEPTPEALAAVAQRTGLDPARLRLWVGQLRSAGSQPRHPLHGLAHLGQARSATSPALPPGLRVLADFTQPDRQPWKVDGEAFGSGPLRPGKLVPGRSPTNAIARVMSYGAARRDGFWSRLATVPGNEGDSGRLAATSRSGQMVRTPTFTLGEGKLHYLVQGRTRVYAAVDSHLMLEGPLHGQLVQKFDTGTASEPQWVTHDLSAYAGHRTHLEFGPEGDGELEVLLVVEAAEAPQWKPPVPPVVVEASGVSAGPWATAFQQAADQACDWLARGAAEEASIGILAVADWLVRNPELWVRPGGPVPAPEAEAYFRAEQELGRRVQWESATALAWLDGTGVEENVLVRGKPTKPGPMAPRSLPAAFAAARPLTPTDSSGRHELGRQLVDPANPLVARVIVNRVWHHLFGRGLVPTVDNFGTLGERPTHPELLDHLAWQFAHEDGWSIKRLIRRLALTQTYAQSHRVADSRALEVDPANQLWHCVPVRRLEAEAIRDALLTVSGRLNPSVGGPPIPVHLTEFVVGRGRPDRSGPLDGEGRRSLYTAVKRNFLPTTLLTFDSPPPFTTVGRRNVTNVPAQSLALMNDPLFQEQARVWAVRLLRERPSADLPARIAWLFESAYGRLPTAGERMACEESLAELRLLHGASGDAVEVWADLCHALLNANEFIYVL